MVTAKSSLPSKTDYPKAPPPGAYSIATDDQGIAYLNDESQGPQGPEGPRGPRGFIGERGEKGDQGIQGIPGPQGPQGDPGNPNLQGFSSFSIENNGSTIVSGQLVDITEVGINAPKDNLQIIKWNQEEQFINANGGHDLVSMSGDDTFSLSPGYIYRVFLTVTAYPTEAPLIPVGSGKNSLFYIRLGDTDKNPVVEGSLDTPHRMWQAGGYAYTGGGLVLETYVTVENDKPPKNISVYYYTATDNPSADPNHPNIAWNLTVSKINIIKEVELKTQTNLWGD